MSFSKFFLSVSLALAISSFGVDVCFGQFDMDGQRWTGPNTAYSQAQGYDQGDPLKLTWGIAQEGMIVGQFSSEADTPNVIRSFFNGIHGTEADWLPIFESTFGRWASISGLEYEYEANDDGEDWVISSGVLGTRADVRISAHSIDGQSGSNTLAYNFFPDFADQVIDSDNVSFYSDASNNYRGTRNVLTHETGHGIGMSHLLSNDSAQLMEPFINNSFDGPQYFDILAAQRGYGDFNEKSFAQLGNDDASRATDLGTLTDGGIVEIGQDAKTFVVDLASDDFISIDDDSDTDFFRFSVDGDGIVDIDLEALGFTFLVGPQSGGSQNPFDTTLRSDLKLDFFDSALTSLGSSDLTGLGGMESLTGIEVSAGDYFIRVSGADNVDSNLFDVQFYGLSASFTLNPVPEPTAIPLLLMGLAAMGSRRRRS